MSTKYTYSISTDFPNGKLEEDRLIQEIAASAIIIAFNHISTSGDVCDVWFKAVLSSSDETILDGLVAAHSGEPLPDPTTSDGKPIFHLDAPAEADGKPVYVMSPSTEGFYTWLTARGDDLSPTPPSSGRGEGQKIYLSWDGTEDPWPATKEAVLDWCEPIELHDGHINFDPTKWGFEDEWSFFVRLPANTVEANGGGTGNCNVAMVQQLTPWSSETAYSPGDLVTHEGINYACILASTDDEPPNATYWAMTLNIIVPAAGDGAFDIDLNEAVPTPCGNDENGYWNIADKWTETIVPNAVGPIKGTWNLFDFSNEMYFMKNLNCGDPRGIWDIDAYKAEWISSRWKLVFKCTRASPGAGEIGGDLMCFRPGAL